MLRIIRISRILIHNSGQFAEFVAAFFSRPFNYVSPNKEPIPDFRIVAAAEDGYNHPPLENEPKFSALMQGQRFENIGHETLF